MSGYLKRTPQPTVEEIVATLTAKRRRFVLAASARRAKSYLTLARHSRGGSGLGLRRLFLEVRGDRRRLHGRYVL
ncbi:MAG TPA: hypothetical protein VF606_00510, partial [Geminicoccaceae bacterium]